MPLENNYRIFLFNIDMCMLNGRNNVCNDFTSVSTKGKSLVDYCFVNHCMLQNFVDFENIKVSTLVNNSRAIGEIVPTAIS
jgi:hypothetical protein